MSIWYDTTEEEMRQFQAEGFFPVWVEDITEGMQLIAPVYVGYDKGVNGGSHIISRHTVDDMRSSITTQYSGQEGWEEETRDHKIVRWFGIEDDGFIREFSFGQGHYVYAFVPEDSDAIITHPPKSPVESTTEDLTAEQQQSWDEYYAEHGLDDPAVTLSMDVSAEIEGITDLGEELAEFSPTAHLTPEIIEIPLEDTEELVAIDSLVLED